MERDIEPVRINVKRPAQNSSIDVQLEMRDTEPMSTFYTIGHSTRTIDEFISLLKENEIACLIDVRSYPGSRRYPHFNKEVLPENLALHGIQYEHILKLGGRRRKSKTVSPETNGLWTHPAFHNYADYTMSPEFEEGFAELRRLGEQTRIAYMCSEAVWWQCHRRIITDYLLAAGEKVIHIMAPGKLDDATPTKHSGCCDGKPTYAHPEPLLI